MTPNMKRRHKSNSRVAGHAWLVASCLLWTLWLGSVVFSVKFYGDQFSAAYTEGFLGLYWGADADTRTCRIHNNFVPPWDASGAGGSLAAGTTWEIYGPDLLLAPSTLWYNLESGAFPQRALGLWWPIVRSGEALVMPVWIPAMAISIPAILSRWLRRQRPQGSCRRCGYELTGNVSGICPECGTSIEAQES